MLDAPYEGWNRELEVELDSGPFRAHFREGAKSEFYRILRVRTAFLDNPYFPGNYHLERDHSSMTLTNSNVPF